MGGRYQCHASYFKVIPLTFCRSAARDRTRRAGLGKFPKAKTEARPQPRDEQGDHSRCKNS